MRSVPGSLRKRHHLVRATQIGSKLIEAHNKRARKVGVNRAETWNLAPVARSGDETLGSNHPNDCCAYLSGAWCIVLESELSKCIGKAAACYCQPEHCLHAILRLLIK